MRFLLICLWQVTGFAGTHALLIGVGNYPQTDFRLNGPSNDVALMKQTLTAKYPGIHFYTLLDAKATRTNILSALDQFQALKAEDRLIIYYSGHGSRAEDFNNDELLEFDSTWVAYGSRLGDGPDSYDVLDDEIDATLAKLATRDIIFISDSCHSGSVGHSSLERSLIADKRQHPQAHLRLKSRPEGIVYLGAVRDDQRAIESPIGPGGRYFGIFTYSFTQILMAAHNETRWQDVMHGIKALMNTYEGARKLEPQISGNVDRQLNFEVGAQATIRAVVVGERQGAFLLDVGRVAGFSEGTLFQSKGNLLRLKRADLFFSLAEIVEGTAPEVGQLFFLKKLISAGEPLRLSARAMAMQDESATDLAEWVAWNFTDQITWVDDAKQADWVLVAARTRHGRAFHQRIPEVFSDADPTFWLADPNGDLIIQRPLAFRRPALKNSLQRLLRRQSLLDLENPYQLDDLEFEAVFCSKREGNGRKPITLQDNTYYLLENGVSPKRGDIMAPKFVNRSAQPRYIYCLYFEPDGTVRCIFPRKEMPDQVARFEPSESRLVDAAAMVLDIRGSEQFRLISSKLPIQRNLLESQSAEIEETRKGLASPHGANDWSTRLFRFQVQ